MQLHLSTWQEVESYLGRSKGIMVPIGSTEQHGPNGMIGTDAICPEVIARHAAEAAEEPILIGPTIAVGMAQHHLAFPGSVTLRPSTLILVIRDYVMSLARNGFERFYFLNGHGGNVATIGAAFSEIYAETSLRAGANTPGIRCMLRNWYETPAAKAISAELFAGREGSHATPSEVSVTFYAYPEHVKSAEMRQAATAPRPFADAEDYRRLYPDGRIGSDPTLASVEHGRRIVHAVAKDVVSDYRQFLTMA